jgi:anti-sigma factor RsiW
MTHGISDQEWAAYLDGRLDSAGRDRLEAHLIGCLACWNFYEEMAETNEWLKSGGSTVRRELTPTDEQLQAGFVEVFARINDSAGQHAGQQARPEVRKLRTRYTDELVRRRLDSLAAVIAPMCGESTARRALKCAAADSPARSLEQLTPHDWGHFLASLTSIASVMCGETGASLVWESGQL